MFWPFYFVLCDVFKTVLIFIHNFHKGNFVIHVMNFLATFCNSVTEMSKIWDTLYKNYSELACTGCLAECGACSLYLQTH
jgi:hypothetical protein